MPVRVGACQTCKLASFGNSNRFSGIEPLRYSCFHFDNAQHVAIPCRYVDLSAAHSTERSNISVDNSVTDPFDIGYSERFSVGSNEFVVQRREGRTMVDIGEKDLR